MDKRYTVFVSSTYKDLVDARWAVARALMRLNLIPLGMEAFTASEKNQWDIIKKTIDLSDYYVLILGNCYGSIDSETGISYTEKEYRYALEQGIPCLTFISKDVPILPEHRESDAHREKLDALRSEVSKSRMIDFWKNADELTAQVTTALVMGQIDTPRPGWIRNPQARPEVTEEIARLSRENAELRSQSSINLQDLIGEISNITLEINGTKRTYLDLAIGIAKYLVIKSREVSSIISFLNKEFNIPKGKTLSEANTSEFIATLASYGIIEHQTVPISKSQQINSNWPSIHGGHDSITQYILTKTGLSILRSEFISHLKSQRVER
ncbi:hypothetical protein CBQ26_10995 [Deinococcus indicus]|uniref:DUF4062 domain-containing protein n=1 Tax=Deinococcus indicus TaxID=223556 RepID=A0A246BKH9_9DEIO|nr:DUF4062 domain-containing protein [Deinococcus indicus]OWL95792.1 hypothetical protein CBQ26_10995 [Deinococcus indicus]